METPFILRIDRLFDAGPRNHPDKEPKEKWRIKALSIREVISMSTVYKAAIIGCGRIASTIDDEVQGHPGIAMPYAHAGGYLACPHTQLVAAADVVEEKAQALCQRWNVPHPYRDYREMIECERPDIISITTRPNTHAEITCFAAAHGVRGIYCEKPLCCSMEEADRMLEACSKAGVKFNYGTNRRYIAVFQRIREYIEKREMGSVRSIIAYAGGNCQWTHTHTADLLLNLAGDSEVECVQATLGGIEEEDFEDNALEKDPSVLLGFVRFRNGLHGYLIPASTYEVGVEGSEGSLRTQNDAQGVFYRKPEGRWRQWKETSFPTPAVDSGCLNCIEDLVAAIDSGGETKGNLPLACRSQEIVLGWVESHRQGGIRISLPLENRALAIRPPDW